MTNETTASQPKSIGDDVKLENLLSEYASAVNRATSLDRETFLREEIIRLFHSSASADQASATIQAAADDFDAWQKNPYTLVLQKSIAEDYVPRSAGSGVHADDIAVDRFAAAMKQRMAEMRAKGRKGWDNPKKCAIAYLMQSLKAIPLSQPVDVGNYAMMLFNRAIWENEGYPNASTIQEPAMVAEPDNRSLKQAPDLGQGDASTRLWLQAHGYGNVTPLHALIDLSERIAKFTAAPMVADSAGVEVTYPCWSCKKSYTLDQRSYADGRCPHCDVDIDLEMDDEADAATVKAVPSEAPAKRNEQAKFEEWSVKWKYNLRPANEGSADTYMEGETETAWMGWMACVDSFAAPLADKTGGGE